MTHGIKTLRYYKGADKALGRPADTTVGACTCGRFEVSIAGNRVKEAAGHLAFHLRKHGAEQ